MQKSMAFRNQRATAFRTVTALCSCCWLFLLAASCSGQQQQQPSREDMARMQQQMQQMVQERSKTFEENPRDADARFLLAWAVITTQGISDQAVELLSSSFDPDQVDVSLEKIHPLKGYLASHLAGRYFKEQKDSPKAVALFEKAYEISKTMSPGRDVGETCTHLQLATELEAYPLTSEEVDASVARMEEWALSLIDLYAKKHRDVYLNNEWLAQTMPGYPGDPFVHCVLTLFPLSFYYRADVAKIANLHYQLSVLAFPELKYTAPRVEAFDLEQLAYGDAAPSSSKDGVKVHQTCATSGKIKLGVISSTLSEGHSVSEDFGGILQRLDRDVFDVSYHYLHEKSSPMESAKFMTANPTDRLFHYTKTPADDKDGAWLRRIGREIEAFEFDVILYLDLTMSTWTRRLGMERLAPVQINSHGHPITSGIPRDTIQHFVSWAEAELPLEESQNHYTEELQLIPEGKIHQYYTPRVLQGPNGQRISRMNGQPFDHLTRKDFEELSPAMQNSGPDDEDIHVYVCMQKPFKIFPEFDELLCGILRRDPQGHAILHKEDASGHDGKFVTRLTNAGCDMERVHFVSQQPPHKLMVLYETASVVLDSYPAGGCTTSREVLELGKAIVTWPARLLGGRWTLGLYNTIGLDEDAKTRLIASSKEEYIAKAVELGTNRSLREAIEGKIREAVPSLFGRQEAVEEWERILRRVSPVKVCPDGSSSSAGADEL